ncbi:hypothetical protein B0H17DRAFT_1145503 [Mycena rosella]|uniref:Uncharacterized protein n=1 Tax=Mycena rosella TaxID=1033263 RepID=A0AAD7CR42_MYCRO|nr:hypothetical protein B0H17DRAFT_1145503 [Mycena rosella]
MRWPPDIPPRGARIRGRKSGPPINVTTDSRADQTGSGTRGKRGGAVFGLSPPPRGRQVPVAVPPVTFDALDSQISPSTNTDLTLGMEPILPVYLPPWVSPLSITIIIPSKEAAVLLLSEFLADAEYAGSTWFTDGPLLLGSAGDAAVQVVQGKYYFLIYVVAIWVYCTVCSTVAGVLSVPRWACLAEGFDSSQCMVLGVDTVPPYAIIGALQDCNQAQCSEHQLANLFFYSLGGLPKGNQGKTHLHNVAYPDTTRVFDSVPLDNWESIQCLNWIGESLSKQCETHSPRWRAKVPNGSTYSSNNIFDSLGMLAPAMKYRQQQKSQPGLLALGRPKLDNDGSGRCDRCVAYDKQLANLESQHMDSDLPDNEIVLNTDIDIPIAVGCTLFAMVTLIILDDSETDVENFYIPNVVKYEASITDRLWVDLNTKFYFMCKNKEKREKKYTSASLPGRATAITPKYNSYGEWDNVSALSWLSSGSKEKVEGALAGKKDVIRCRGERGRCWSQGSERKAYIL